MDTNSKLYQDLDYIMLTREQIAARIRELGQTIARDYKDHPPVVLCILKGSVVFLADLIREIDLPVELEFLTLSSYGSGTESSGQVIKRMDVSKDFTGKDILVVEDIVDSGRTLSFLKKDLENKNAASVAIVTLLDKPARRVVPLTPDYCGFTIEDAFVVGYGLDYDEKYRNLPDIGVLAPRIYSEA